MNEITIQSTIPILLPAIAPVVTEDGELGFLEGVAVGVEVNLL